MEKLPEPEEVTDSNEGEGRRRPAYVPPEYIPQAFDSIDISSALDAFKGGIDLPVVHLPSREQGLFLEPKKRISVLRAAIDSGVVGLTSRQISIPKLV